MREMLRATLLAVAMIILAMLMVCEAHAQPVGAVEFHPPSTYAQAWYEVEDCLGVHKDMRAVTFYRVRTPNGRSFVCGHYFFGLMTQYCHGQYSVRANAIYLAEQMTGNEVLVKHEMVHALGIHDHPVGIFLRCAGDDQNGSIYESPLIGQRVPWTLF